MGQLTEVLFHLVIEPIKFIGSRVLIFFKMQLYVFFIFSQVLKFKMAYDIMENTAESAVLSKLENLFLLHGRKIESIIGL